MYIMCLSKGIGAIQEAIDEGVLPHKRLGFIPTAGETYENPYFVDESRKRLQQLGLELVEVDVSSYNRSEIIASIESVDGLFVAGGNSFYLLQQLQKKELVDYIKDKVRGGMPYFGESAGAVILHETLEPIRMIDEPEDAPDLHDTTALGLINFIPLPHVGREKYAKVFAEFLKENELNHKIVKYRDDQAVMTRDGRAFDMLPSAISDVRG